MNYFTMSPVRLTAIFLLLSVCLLIINANPRQFRFYELDRNAEYWQKIRHMPCAYKQFQDGLYGIVHCIQQCSYDAEYLLVGTNLTHCILCNPNLNGTVLKASQYQGDLFVKRGKNIISIPLNLFFFDCLTLFRLSLFP